MRHLFLAAALLVAVLGCTSNPVDETLDATTRPDAANIVDAGTMRDASVGPDSGGQPDGALERDASSPVDSGRDAGSTDAAVSDAHVVDASSDASTDGGDTATCPPDVVCVDTFPFRFDGDTDGVTARAFDGYSCAPNTDEGGPEVVFRVTVPADGFLSVAVYDGTGVDIDVHILSALDAQTCADRGDKHASADVTAGSWWVVADTYVSGGVEQAGAFSVDIGFLEPSQGACAMESGEMPRVGDNGVHLAMPATGPIVLEAHLVTQEEPQPYPTTSTEELPAHYALSQARTGLVMHRTQVWAPLEGGSFYGAGIGSPTLFPVLHEAWYVNMYWTSTARPARGTRMLLREPGGSRAVVVAAGYETGPGNLSHIGGTPEETHFYMGTTHLDVMQIGIAADQSLPFGPRVCDP